MDSKKIMFWVCGCVALTFCYAKYFLATNELQEFGYGIYGMLWLLLGLLVVK